MRLAMDLAHSDMALPDIHNHSLHCFDILLSTAHVLHCTGLTHCQYASCGGEHKLALVAHRSYLLHLGPQYSRITGTTV